MREKLVNAILEHSEDELGEHTLADIARESEEQLVDRLINILGYYAREYNQ